MTIPFAPRLNARRSLPSRRLPLAVTCLASVLLLVQAAPLYAQPAPPPGSQTDVQYAGDPPARVGRVSTIQGTVSFHTAAQDQWNPATLNWPVAQGNSFWTEAGSRAVMELGGVRLSMDGSTEVDIQQMDYDTVLINLPQGDINIRLRDLGDGEKYMISTPSGTVQLLTAGRYHVDGGANGNPGSVAIYAGQAAVLGDGGATTYYAGQSGVIVATAAPPPVEATAPTPIDTWADEVPPPPPVPAYLPPDMPGEGDLLTVGVWSEAPDYGHVWYPPVDPGWAPYRYGHWGYVAPWGWTWVDDAPWGFAPFHYGRWVEIDGRWGWTPGRVIDARPVYAPALVTFIGGGGWNPGVGVSVGLGLGVGALAVGWVALGPEEVYHPWYHTSDTYIRNVNVTNVTNVTNITNVTNVTNISSYRNYRAATVVNSNAMESSQPISHAVLKVPPEAIASAPLVHRGEAPIKPSLATAGATRGEVSRVGGNLSGAPPHPTAPGPMENGHPRILPVTTPANIKPITPPKGGFAPQQGPAGQGLHPGPILPGQHAPGPQGQVGHPPVGVEPTGPTVPKAPGPPIRPATPQGEGFHPPGGPAPNLPPATHAPGPPIHPQGQGVTPPMERPVPQGPKPEGQTFHPPAPQGEGFHPPGGNAPNLPPQRPAPTPPQPPKPEGQTFHPPAPQGEGFHPPGGNPPNLPPQRPAPTPPQMPRPEAPPHVNPPAPPPPVQHPAPPPPPKPAKPEPKCEGPNCPK